MALQLEEDSKEEQKDDHRLHIAVSTADDRLGPREEITTPERCSSVCGPRTCATLPPTLRKHGPGSSEPKKRRLWGLRGLVKMFRRRTRRKGMDPSDPQHSPINSLRTRSASELAVDQSIIRSSGGPYNQGLSVSHDSVFSPESPNEEQHSSTSNLALITRGVNMAELKSALRRRRTNDSGSPDDDPGLPRSPPTSPNTFDVLYHGFKNSSRATQSSCSDASLLSMGSSEYDEDSFGSISLHSSRASLMEGRNYSIDNEPAVGTVTLSHNAARHKMAVRPRRTHAISKMRKQPALSSSYLPITIELNEESMQKNTDVIQETPVTMRNSKKNLPLKGDFHAREAVEALVVELVTEKSKNYFSRSFEENRSSHITELDCSPCKNLASSNGNIDVVEVLGIKSGINKERNKSDPTSFSKRISIGDSYWSSVCSQRASSLEGILGEVKAHDKYFPNRVLNNESQVVARGIFGSSDNVVSPPVNNLEQSKTTLLTGRKVESCISVNETCKIILPKPNLSEEQTTKLLGSLNNRESRSSIDNLTTTLLPGIYIRPFSPKINESTEKASDDSSKEIELMLPSISDSPMELRNIESEICEGNVTSNVDYGVICLNLDEHVADNVDRISTEDKKIKHEPSITSQAETKVDKVPEFMRVHLNRVNSINSPVILNTGNQLPQVSLDKDSSVPCLTLTTMQKSNPTSPVKPPRKDKLPETVLERKNILIDTTSVEYKEEIPVVMSAETNTKEEIILRRPSLLEKSVILEQNYSSESSKKSRTDQPELLKVFARRSFKLKENEADDSKLLQESLKKKECLSSDSTEIKKEVNKTQINALKRYSIGSSPLPFGARFADTNITTNIPPIDSHQVISNIGTATTSSEPINTENSSIISPSLNNEANVQSATISTQCSKSEILPKMAYSRRSFSHVALKPIQSKSTLGRTSSANQSDFISTSVMINKPIINISEKTKEIVDDAKDTRLPIENKPTITTKPIVWPPVKTFSDPPLKMAPVEVIKKPHPVICDNADTTKVLSNSTTINELKNDSETKENSVNNGKLFYRFNSETPRKASLAEARNTSFAQSLIIENAKKDSLSFQNESGIKPAVNDESAGDWRVLVRQRREDRLKHTKSMDADEIIMETRPNANRSSKVLEMANNFQKLQVA